MLNSTNERRFWKFILTAPSHGVRILIIFAARRNQANETIFRQEGPPQLILCNCLSTFILQYCCMGSIHRMLQTFVSQKKIIRRKYILKPLDTCKPIYINEQILTTPCIYIYICQKESISVQHYSIEPLT